MCRIENLLNDLIATPHLIAPDVDGMSSAKVRLLLNRIVGMKSEWNHLEIGSYKGSTLISALYENMTSTATAFENHSEYSVRDELMRNLKKYAHLMGEYNLLEEDFFSGYKKLTKNSYDSMFYDGDHSFSAQKKAVEISRELCKSEYYLIIDDWNIDRVRWGTWAGVHNLRPRAMKFWELHSRFNWDSENFHNGIGLYKISV